MSGKWVAFPNESERRIGYARAALVGARGRVLARRYERALAENELAAALVARDVIERNAS